ncbi:MAG: hypothetical protein IIZ33_05740 [Erysipelotrichaceae bacterium]|nr:hypothetical protein [Erysipelotrichaceae bacterium]
MHFSLFDKFFGTGVEMQWTWYGELSERLSTWFVSSHSIPIQILFTMGCFGLAVFIVVVTLIILRCHHRNNGTCLPYFFSLLAFLGTSLFNSADPCNFGLMILILILFLKESSEETE